MNDCRYVEVGRTAAQVVVPCMDLAGALKTELRAPPPGVRREMIVEFVAADAPVDVPAGVQQFVLTRLEGAGSWGVGPGLRAFSQDPFSDDLLPPWLGAARV